MKILWCVVILFLISGIVFGQDKVTPAPTGVIAKEATIETEKPAPVVAVPEITKLKIQLATANLQILQYQYLQVKAEYDKITAETSTKYQQATAELTAMTEAAYKSMRVDKEKFRFDPGTGEFLPIVAAKPNNVDTSKVDAK